jgi:ribosomal-protein-alanine N-acetyltransferase
MQETDLDAVLTIERASFPSPWSKALFQQELENAISRCLVVERAELVSQGELVAYVCFWVVHDEIHIMNLATAPRHRRKGIARMLLGRALQSGRKKSDARRALLEVRRSNAAAKSLYHALGFRVVGTRRGYYQDTGEDALVMSLEVEGWRATP